MALSKAEKMINLGMPPELAKVVQSNLDEVEAAGLQIGTTGTTAMAGNRTPTSTIRGGVLQQVAQADSTAVDVAGLVTDFNALLAKLRTAGVLASS